MPRIKKSGLVVCQEVTDCLNCEGCEHSKPHVYDGEMGICYGNCSHLNIRADCVPIETIKNLPNFS